MVSISPLKKRNSRYTSGIIKTRQKTVIFLCIIIFLILLLPINTITSTPFISPLISEGNVVSVSYTQEDLVGRIRWDSFLEDINEAGNYLDFSIGSFDNILFQMEMDFDSGIITGLLSGSAAYDFWSMKNHLSFNGEFTGVIDKYNWNYNNWFWEFGSNFTLTLTCSKEQYYTNEQNEVQWNTREETIQVVAELTGDSFAGNGGIGMLNVKWEDPGTGADDSRKFTLYCKNKLSSGGCDLPADLPDVIDIYARITGPDMIRNTDSGITFNIDASGVDVDLVEEVNWYFYYYDDVLWLDYRWFESFKNTDFSSLVIDEEKLSEWTSYVSDYGKTENNEKRLPMQVYVEIKAGEEEWLSETDNFNFTYVLEESSGFELDIDKKNLDVYPTSKNETYFWLELENTVLSDKVTFEIIETLPEYLKIELEKSTVSGPIPDTITNKLIITLDMTKSTGLILPSEQTITIKAKSKKGTENIEDSKQLTLKLKPVEWLILHYISEQSYPFPILQGNDETNINDILNAFQEKKNPKIGYILLFDLAKSTYISGLNLDKGAHLLKFFNGKLEKIESNTVNMANPATLESFIEKSLKIYPSKKTNLIISNHGNGIQGVAIEGNRGDTVDTVDYLTPREISIALTKYNFDLICFETCLTSNVELLYELRENTEFIVASQGNMYGTGYFYENIMPKLLSNPYMTAEQYATEFIETYTHEYKQITLALVKTSSLGDLKNKVDELAKSIQEEYTKNNELFHKEVIKTYKMTTSIDECNSIDLFDFCENILLNNFSSTIKEKAESVKALKNSVVIKNKVNNAHSKKVLINRGLVPTLDEDPIDLIEEPVSSFKKETKISSHNGISIWFWGSGIDNEAYKLIKSKYDLTEFAKNTAWKGFIEDYMNGQSEPKVIISVDQHKKNLFARIIDEEGLTIGYNPESTSRNKIEIDYSDIVYYRYLDGTTEFVLPAGLADISVIVDGGSMEEEEESYTLNLIVVYDDEILFEKTQDVSISIYNEHSIPITLDDESITLGEINVTDNSPEPDPESNPEPQPSGGIPGFPIESSILSILLVSVLMWMMRKKH